MAYVHGYAADEARRLGDQAEILEGLLHRGTRYPPGARVLELGCGVGAQSVALARRSPQAHFFCVDRDPGSLAQAAARCAAAGLANLRFLPADAEALPFPEAHFDHAFVCFVLEHLADPARALAELRRVLRPGGSLTVIEGDHGSALFSPEAPAAQAVIAALVAAQRRAGGDALIGRRLFALLREAGFGRVRVRPRVVYADASRPAVVEGFVRRTFIAMVAGARGQTSLPAATFAAGLAALERTTCPDGSFAYTFFKAVARRRAG